MRALIVITPLFLLVLLSAAPAFAERETWHFKPGECSAVGGDGLRCGSAFRVTAFRLAGIIAPAASTRAGQRSADYLRQMIAGQPVTCIGNGVVSRRQLLATCWTDNKDLARQMLREGKARNHPHFTPHY